MRDTSTKLASRALAVSCLAAVVLVIVLFQPWPLFDIGRAQENMTRRAASVNRAKLLIRSDKGAVLSASQDQPNEQTLRELGRLLERHPGTWKVELAQAFVEDLFDRLRPYR